VKSWQIKRCWAVNRYKSDSKHTIQMSFLFGGQAPTTAEMASRFKMKINRSVREIDRESARLVTEEKQLMSELKREASKDVKLAMQKAHAIVRTRRMTNKFSHMKVWYRVIEI